MMPDALLWLGVTKIDRFISMSDMKYDAIVATGSFLTPFEYLQSQPHAFC